MLLRHPDQDLFPPGYEVVEPPRDFAEQAYAAGVDQGTGTVTMAQGEGVVIAHIKAKMRGVWIELYALAETNDRAVANLLRAIRRVGQ